MDVTTAPTFAGTDLDMGQIRILHVVPPDASRGVHRQVMDLVVHLDQSRFCVEVLVGGAGPRSLWREAEDSGVVVHWVAGTWSRHLVLRQLSMCRALYNRVKDNSYDIIHTHYPLTTISRLAVKRAGALQVVHSCPLSGGAAENRRRRVGRLWKERQAARLSDALIAGTTHAAQELAVLKVGDTAQFKEIRAGIDLDFYRRWPGDIRPMNFGRGPIIGTIGRLTKKSGVDVILRAMRELATKHADILLCVIGEGPAKDELERLTISMGLDQNVRYVGDVEDVRPWLASMDLLVLCAGGDDAYRAIQQALALGRPVVACGAGAIPEIVRDGVVGRLLDGRSPEDLSQAVDELLSDPCRMQVMGRLAQIGSLEFDIHSTASDTECLYEKMVSLSENKTCA